MATLQKRLNRRGGVAWSLQLYLAGARKTISFPASVSKRDAEDARHACEILQDAHAADRPLSRRESQTIDALPDTIKQKFERVGLLDSRERLTLADVWDRWIETADNTGEYTPNTLRNYRQARRVFCEFFDSQKKADDLTASDAVAWRAWLVTQYATATVSCHVKRAKTVWSWAAESGLCAANPFAHVVAGSQQNKIREYIVTIEAYNKLLDACPNQTWRTMLAMARVGGLRCPSEVLAITWHDVDWERGRLRVVSNKQRKHADKHARVIPLWPALRVQLERQFEAAMPGGSPFVIAEYRDTAANLRTGLERIIFRAGLLQWPRLWQNLRVSRSNEIWRQYPPHLAEYWLNQSQNVASKHYLHATDDDYTRALANESTTAPNTPASPEETTALK